MTHTVFFLWAAICLVINYSSVTLSESKIMRFFASVAIMLIGFSVGVYLIQVMEVKL
jgi:hypothetical protein